MPEEVSTQLPSRGATMVAGTINGFPFRAVLEPDGRGSHWLRVDGVLGEGAGVVADDAATLAIEPASDWLEPAVPADLLAALATIPRAQEVWTEITTVSRWDWIRWIRSTKEPQTRRRRIERACEMLASGKRRPCCFNRNLCTEPDVSQSGVLLQPRQGELPRD